MRSEILNALDRICDTDDESVIAMAEKMENDALIAHALMQIEVARHAIQSRVEQLKEIEDQRNRIPGKDEF